VSGIVPGGDPIRKREAQRQIALQHELTLIIQCIKVIVSCLARPQRTAMVIGVLTLHLEIPGCRSLKEKRSQIKPVLARLHREFNLSTAELELQDHRSQAVIGAALLTSDRNVAQASLMNVLTYFENHWPDLPVLQHHIELI